MADKVKAKPEAKATAMIEVPLVETQGSVDAVFVTLLPRHRRLFHRLRRSLHEAGETYKGGANDDKHVDTNAGVFHWLLDQIEIPTA